MSSNSMIMPDINCVLLVDDSPSTNFYNRKLIEIVDVSNQVFDVENGLEALEYIKCEGKFKDKTAFPRPNIIFLDINMPRMNGIEFLREREKDVSLKKIPVIMLTSSREDQDRLESFQHSIAGYMIKPVNFDQFVKMMDTINGYWSISEIAD